MRYPMPSAASGTALRIAARTCSIFGLTASGWAAMYSSTDLGTLYFMPLILCSACGFSSPSGFPYVRRPLRHGQPPSSSSTVEYSDVCEPDLDKKSPIHRLGITRVAHHHGGSPVSRQLGRALPNVRSARKPGAIRRRFHWPVPANFRMDLQPPSRGLSL